MIKLILKGNPAYCWTNTDNSYFIGYIYNSCEKINRGPDAINLLKGLLEVDKIIDEEIRDFDGMFSFICSFPDKTIILTDIVNFFPVFYMWHENQWVISNDWQSLVDHKSKFDLNSNASIGFLSGGFVCGNKTLDKEINKTQAADFLTLNSDGTITQKRHFDFIPKKFSDLNYSELIDRTESVFLEAGKDLIKFLDNRTAVVPLSGGYDSRLIVCLLKMFDYKNVICFTYGKKTKEVDISKNVAGELGYKWYFINYSEINYDNYLQDTSFVKYVQQYSNGYSMFFLQEYFAVHELIKMGIIPDNSVFLPGHSGDFIGGSYVEKTAATKISPNRLSDYLLKKYFFFKKPYGKSKKILLHDIQETLQPYPETNIFSNKYNPYVEDWDIKEKLSKFIFRSSYVFTHFGFEHIYPLWNRKTTALFREIPYEMRSFKKLYNKVLIEKFFIPLNVYFNANELNRVSKQYMRYQDLKDIIRNSFPWNLVLKRMIKNDWLNYYEFTKEMEKDLIKKGYRPLKRYKMFTAIICRWYLDNIITTNRNINQN